MYLINDLHPEHEQLTKLNIKNQQPNKKISVTYWKRQFTRHIWMEISTCKGVQHHTWEMQTYIIVCSYHTPTRMVKLFLKNEHSNVENMEELELIYTNCGNV